MSKLKRILTGIFEITIGCFLLLVFSFCMYLGSTMLGKKAVESQEKLYENDTVNITEDSLLLEEVIIDTIISDTIK